MSHRHKDVSGIQILVVEPIAATLSSLPTLLTSLPVV